MKIFFSFAVLVACAVTTQTVVSECRKDPRKQETVVVASNAAQTNEKCNECGGGKEDTEQQPQTEPVQETQQS